MCDIYRTAGKLCGTTVYISLYSIYWYTVSRVNYFSILYKQSDKSGYVYKVKITRNILDLSSRTACCGHAYRHEQHVALMLYSLVVDQAGQMSVLHCNLSELYQNIHSSDGYFTVKIENIYKPGVGQQRPVQYVKTRKHHHTIMSYIQSLVLA